MRKKMVNAVNATSSYLRTRGTTDRRERSSRLDIIKNRSYRRGSRHNKEAESTIVEHCRYYIMSRVLAQQQLDTLANQIRQQSPHTLAFWRINHQPIFHLLNEFAGTDSQDADQAELLVETQKLFNGLNSILSEQERTDPNYMDYQHQLYGANSVNHTENSISVVFGGKLSSANPQSISETLVARILESARLLYTVSRSPILNETKKVGYHHYAKQNLDNDDHDLGSSEFLEVMEQAKKEWILHRPISSPPLLFFFTLGQHKGINPFVRNLNAVWNFCLALETALKDQEDTNWKIVLTGTDATLPSSTEVNSQLSMGEETIVIPTYKISEYNFVYAMSKLGQYYLVMNCISKLVGRDDISKQTDAIVKRIENSVRAAGENGKYQKPSADDDSITMEELDDYSKQAVAFESQLQNHFMIAKGISICYTPLHAKPWTEQAIASSEGQGLSPKAFVLEQVVKRLKNAISIDQAVDRHFF